MVGWVELDVWKWRGTALGHGYNFDSGFHRLTRLECFQDFGLAREVQSNVRAGERTQHHFYSDLLGMALLALRDYAVVLVLGIAEETIT
jgi:hypothetical protein